MDYKKCMKSSKSPAKLCKRGYCTAKSKFKVYPSDYANGYAAQVCAGKSLILMVKRRRTITERNRLRVIYRVGTKKIGLMYAQRTKREIMLNADALLLN